MEIDACFQLGYISGTHGLSGEVHAVLDVDDPRHYTKLESVFLSHTSEGPLVPFFIERLTLKDKKALVKFEEISSLDEARHLIGNTLYLPLEGLPTLAGTAFYFHEIIGCQVFDTNLGTLGNVSGIYDQSPQLLIGMSYGGKEVLIPYNDDIVQGFNRQSSQLKVTLPHGLIEIYLEDQ